MKKIDFTKMVASGNDFIVIEAHQFTRAPGRQSLVKMICDRKYGVGADGVLVLEKSNKANIRMRIFNADGSEADMCGNGARCAALYVSRQSTVDSPQKKINIETKAGIIESIVNKDNVKIKLTQPKDIKLNIPIKINNRILNVNFIDTGVPHVVIFAQGLESIDVDSFGRAVRYHSRFAPSGANVNFVEVLNKDSIKIRTYERGVEGETLACGTGSVASALIAVVSCPMPAGKQELSVVSKVNVYTKGEEILRVSFDKKGNKFINVWLEGKARIVYTGVYYIG